MGVLAAIEAFPAVTGAVGSLLGSGLTGLFNSNSASRQMEFQERMSSTAYQRAAKDMEAAGLNRVLALGNPASSPGGAMGTMPDLGSSVAGGASTGQQIAESKARIPTIRAQESATLATAKAAEAEAKYKEGMFKVAMDKLPYDLMESGGRIRAQGQQFELGELDKSLKNLDLRIGDNRRRVGAVQADLWEAGGPGVRKLISFLGNRIGNATDAGESIIDSARNSLSDGMSSAKDFFSQNIGLFSPGSSSERMAREFIDRWKREEKVTDLDNPDLDAPIIQFFRWLSEEAK